MKLAATRGNINIIYFLPGQPDHDRLTHHAQKRSGWYEKHIRVRK